MRCGLTAPRGERVEVEGGQVDHRLARDDEGEQLLERGLGRQARDQGPRRRERDAEEGGACPRVQEAGVRGCPTDPR